jgi:hypothetical protein
MRKSPKAPHFNQDVALSAGLILLLSDVSSRAALSAPHAQIGSDCWAKLQQHGLAIRHHVW